MNAGLSRYFISKVTGRKWCHGERSMLESLIAISLGVGLAASCGFRVFVPFLIASLAAKAGFVELGAGFDWVGTWPAIIAFAVAATIEIAAYYVPWFDNALDTISTPAASIAGLLLVAACIAEFDPLLRWSLAAIAGGGIAGTVSLGWTGIRAGSTATTGGLANGAVATTEGVGSLVLSVLAIVLPLLAAFIALVMTFFIRRFAFRLMRSVFLDKENAVEKPTA